MHVPYLVGRKVGDTRRAQRRVAIEPTDVRRGQSRDSRSCRVRPAVRALPIDTGKEIVENPVVERCVDALDHLHVVERHVDAVLRRSA